MKDFQLDVPCFSFKEKGETAESERPGERVNWKVCFEMWGTFPLAFFADFGAFSDWQYSHFITFLHFLVRSRFRRTYACYLSWIFSSENGSLQIN